jgi:S-adenosylmethionine synthetase
MFGYACKETDNYMPLALEISHLLLQELADIRREKKVMKYLRPDSKSQVTVEYNDNNEPARDTYEHLLYFDCSTMRIRILTI